MEKCFCVLVDMQLDPHKEKPLGFVFEVVMANLQKQLDR